MTVVRHLLTDPTGAGTAGDFTVELVGAGLRADTQSQIITVQTAPRIGGDGMWSLDLVPNVGVEVDGVWLGDFYRVTFRPPGATMATKLDFVVPAEGVYWLGDLIIGATLKPGDPLYTVLRGDKGDDGEDGDPGPSGSVPRGAWDADTAYEVRDLVSHEGSSFMARAGSTGVVPAAGDTWQLIGEKGDPGQNGGVDDATTTVKGIAVLPGGTADAPTVPQDKVTGAASTSDANVLVRRDAAGRFRAADPAVAADVATKGYADARAVPAGGTTGQVLTKNSGTDRDASWAAPATSGGPICRVKTATTGISSRTSLLDDPHLTVASLPVGSYLLDAAFLISGQSAAGLSLQFAGTALFSGQLASESSAATAVLTFPTLITRTLIGIRGVLTVSTAGSFTLRWAQTTSNSYATSLYEGSYFTLTKF